MTDHFGEAIAQHYDHTTADRFSPEVLDPTVTMLASLARGGAALELGIGTGRVALPLAARGVPVRGIELSPAMVARLRAKPGGDAIDVTIGDFAETRVDGSFRLVYLVFNTINNLTTQAEQVACFANAAAHLEPGGRFVVEVGVPPLRLLPPGESVRAFALTDDHLGFDLYEFASQRMQSHHHWRIDGRWESFAMPFRYVWPSELDLMARLAGLHLAHRWAGWAREPFTDDSTQHVSVWEHPPRS